jgi:hypothetical protein
VLIRPNEDKWRNLILFSQGLTHALKHNSTLLWLEMVGNEMIGEGGATAVAGMLACNTALTKLGLQRTGIPSDGWQVLICRPSSSKTPISHLFDHAFAC